MYEKTNEQILEERMVLHNKLKPFAVGDFIMNREGKVARIAYIWHNQVQTTTIGYFFLGSSGMCQFSGSLDAGVPYESIEQEPIAKTIKASVWFFDRGIVEAHNGVYFKVPFRVFMLKENTVVDPYTKFDDPESF